MPNSVLLSPNSPSSVARRSVARRAVTAKDVAELAGVARPTVSAILNGAKSGTVVSEATRQRILDAAAELGYRPNLAARSTRSGKTRQIGLLLRSFSKRESVRPLSHPLSYEIVCGITDGLDQAGYMTSLLRLGDVSKAADMTNTAFGGHLLDGVVVIYDVNAQVTQKLRQLYAAQVWVDGNFADDVPCVRRDERHAGELCARHLADLGYKTWWVITHANSAHYSAPLRLEGIERVARECGAQIRPYPIGHGGTREMDELLRDVERDHAVIATTFYSATTLQNALVFSTKRPGYDFALACCDDGFHREGSAWAELSRVSFDRYAMGLCAAQTVVELLEKGSAPPIQLLRGQWQSGLTALPLNSEPK